jgi:DNA-damage-inducible protein J
MRIILNMVQALTWTFRRSRSEGGHVVNGRVCRETIMAPQFDRLITELEYVAQLGYIHITLEKEAKMAANAYVRARIDPSVKDSAALVLDSLGLTTSDIIRIVLTRIARDKALPVELTRPNAKTIAAMEEARAIKAGHGKHFDTADEMFESLEGRKVVK